MAAGKGMWVYSDGCDEHNPPTLPNSHICNTTMHVYQSRTITLTHATTTAIPDATTTTPTIPITTTATTSTQTTTATITTQHATHVTTITTTTAQ